MCSPISFVFIGQKTVEHIYIYIYIYPCVSDLCSVVEFNSSETFLAGRILCPEGKKEGVERTDDDAGLVMTEEAACLCIRWELCHHTQYTYTAAAGRSRSCTM